MNQNELNYNSKCKSCGSKNTAEITPFSTKYSIIKFLTFGWWYMIFKSAVRKNKRKCNDCGHEEKFKDAWSWLSTIFIAIVIFLIIGSPK